MGNGTQTLDDVFQFLVAHHQCISTTQQHVAHNGSLLNVFKALLDAVNGRLVVLLTSKTTAGAVTAVHGAHVGDEEQHAVGVTVGKSGCGGILILVQGVVEVGGGDIAFGTLRNGLTTDRVVRVVGVNKA